MSFKDTLKEVQKSKDFQEFKKKNPKAKLYSGFFALRKAQGTLVLDAKQVDYLIEGKRIQSFLLTDLEIKGKEDKLEKPVENFEALDENIKLDIEDIKKIVKDELKKQKITAEPQEIIAILQRHEGKQIWNLIIVLGDLELIRLHLDMEGKIILNKKDNFMDFIRVVKGKKRENLEKMKKAQK